MNERAAGWTIFAGTALLIAGVMRIFDSIWALIPRRAPLEP
jgi:hypothetical protein